MYSNLSNLSGRKVIYLTSNLLTISKYIKNENIQDKKRYISYIHVDITKKTEFCAICTELAVLVIGKFYQTYFPMSTNSN